ncbi:MAG TPA: hypothetical protein VGO58_04260 [Chitinophagaceae bacterium]|jgi:hypothetical protein|nr:hypothetical protein [Chitinophagaceae bacterium]
MQSIIGAIIGVIIGAICETDKNYLKGEGGIVTLSNGSNRKQAGERKKLSGQDERSF